MILGVVVRQVGSDRFWASLGNASWGALVWPLRVDGRDEDGTYSWSFENGGSAEWVFPTNPLSWHAYPHKGIRIIKGIILKQVEAEESLLKWSLRQSIRLSFHDLLRLANHCGVDCNASFSRDQLLDSLANYVAAGDTSYAEAIKSSAKSTPTALLVDDPLFDAAYDALDDDDKREFPEVREARQKGKKRNFEEALNYRRVRAKAKAAAKRRPKAKAKAKAHPGADGFPPPAAPAAAAPAPPAFAAPAPPPAAVPALAAPAPPAAAAPAPPAGGGPPGVSRIPAQALRGERSEPFGTSWVLSEVHPGGVFTTWSCSCYLHKADGQRCNKSLAFFDSDMTPDEAKHRIMQWCIDGIVIPDVPGGKHSHMNNIKPRLYRRQDLQPIHELAALAWAA